MKNFESQSEQKFAQPAEIQPPEFEIEEFERAKPCFENLVKQLIPAVKNHEYNLIIGDDVSGRLPTLVVGGLIKEIYRREKIDIPQILFFLGGRSSCREKISEHLQKLAKENKIDLKQGKTLVVTEYMSSGRSMVDFLGAIKEAGLSGDLAALNTEVDSALYQNKASRFYHPEFKDLRIYSGGTELLFWGEKHLTGIDKDINPLFAKQTPKITDSTGASTSEIVFKARQDVKKMIEYLKQIYDQEKEKTPTV